MRARRRRACPFTVRRLTEPVLGPILGRHVFADPPPLRALRIKRVPPLLAWGGHPILLSGFGRGDYANKRKSVCRPASLRPHTSQSHLSFIRAGPNQGQRS